MQPFSKKRLRRFFEMLSKPPGVSPGACCVSAWFRFGAYPFRLSAQAAYLATLASQPSREESLARM